MTVDGDARKLLAFMDSHHIDGSIQVSRGWGHIGATIVDAALQRRQTTKIRLSHGWQLLLLLGRIRKRLQGSEDGSILENCRKSSDGIHPAASPRSKK